MNILLIRPKPNDESIGLQSFMICEPLEYEYVASYLESFNHTVTIIDMFLEKKPVKYFIMKYKPQIVGLTGYITHVGVVKEYAKEVKNIDPKILTVVGGVHAEVVSEDFEDDHIDYILKANGLKTIKAIIDNYDKDIKLNRQTIAGVWNGKGKEYKIDTSFVYPFPNRNKTKRYRHKYNYIYHNKCATLKTSFGCPYKCEFCFCIKITQNKYFERSMDDVIEEIKTIKEKNIFIVDDNFLLRKERVEKFCSLLEKYNIKKNYILFGRADFIAENEELINRLGKLGLQAVFVGIESFKDDDLNNYEKQTNVNINIKAIQVLERNDIQCYSGIIVGMDWEKKDFDNLIHWLNSFKLPAAVNIQPITPMPGTKLFEDSKDKLIIDRKDYPLWDMAHLVMKPTKMTMKAYYMNLVRAYLKTAASFRSSMFILRKYGLFTYLRVLYGALHIYRQYLKIIKKSENL